MNTRLKSMLPALTLALVSGAALAQFLYKSTMPDGKVIYGDAPMPGALKVEKTKPDTSKKGVTAVTPKEAEALRKKQAETGGSTDPDQSRVVAELEAALRKMEAAREKAKEPPEGYAERMRMYDQGIAALRKELDRARAGK